MGAHIKLKFMKVPRGLRLWYVSRSSCSYFVVLTSFGLLCILSLLMKYASSILIVQISSDGHSCSGQTPDIAWGKFQKNGCPRTKILNGKRFSSKIDGVEVDIGDFQSLNFVSMQKNMIMMSLPLCHYYAYIFWVLLMGALRAIVNKSL